MTFGQQSPDRLAVWAAGTVLLVAVIWLAWGERTVRAVTVGQPATLTGALGETQRVVASPVPDDAAWAMPEASVDPDVWGFEVFTPPIIYYDPATGRFSVAAPEVVEVANAPLAQPFGVRLVSVERQPYPLQLVGYAGTPADPLGIFANEVSGEGIVARSGHRFGDLGLHVQSLVIRREDLVVPESMPLREIVAEAVVRDEREDRQVRLSSARPAWNSQPVAQLVIEATGEIREVVAGNRVELADGMIEITGVFAVPDSVTAVKQLVDGTRETQRLMPNGPAAAQFGGDTIFETP